MRRLILLASLIHAELADKHLHVPVHIKSEANNILKLRFEIISLIVVKFIHPYAPVICIPGSPMAGDNGDTAELKCRDLISDESRQCRGCAWV